MKKQDPYAHTSWRPLVEGIIHPVSVAAIVIALATVVIIFAEEIDATCTDLVRLFFNL